MNIEVKKHIQEVLKRSSDFHNVYTPFELCEEMISKLPKINKDMNIMVMFNLEFLWILKQKLEREGINNIWFMTPCDYKKKAAIGLGINENQIVNWEYNTKEIIEKEKMPKFDVVIGNPPYVEPSRHENRKGKSSMSPNKLWMKFIEISLSNLKKDGHLSFIIPSNWISPTNKLHKKLKCLNILDVNISRDIINYFPGVGGSMNFSTVVLQNSPKQQIPIFTFDNNVKQQIDILSMKVVPMKSSNYLDFLIMQKIENIGKQNGFSNMNYQREDYAIQHNNNIYKVCIPMAKSPVFNVFLTNHNIINSCYVYVPKNIEEGENLTHNLNLPLFQKLRWEIRSGMAIISNIRDIYVPTHKKMTNEESYEYFKLNKDEIEFINKYISEISHVSSRNS